MSPTEFPSYDTAVTEELRWLINYAENLSSEFFNQNVYPPGWATHHASQKRGIQTPPGNNTILPLLRDKVSTFNPFLPNVPFCFLMFSGGSKGNIGKKRVNMQAHLMQLTMKLSAVLNPGQTYSCWCQ